MVFQTKYPIACMQATTCVKWLYCKLQDVIEKGAMRKIRRDPSLLEQELDAKSVTRKALVVVDSLTEDGYGCFAFNVEKMEDGFWWRTDCVGGTKRVISNSDNWLTNGFRI